MSKEPEGGPAGISGARSYTYILNLFATGGFIWFIVADLGDGGKGYLHTALNIQSNAWIYVVIFLWSKHCLRVFRP